MAVDLETMSRRLYDAANVFSPGAPIDKYSLFAGRIEQVNDVINAVSQRGRHVVLYGERGVGKTSLVNVLTEIFSTRQIQGIPSAAVNCDSTDDFSSLWRKIFRELDLAVQRQPMGFNRDKEKQSLSVSGDITPDDVRFVLSSFAPRSLVIIDELDRLKKRDGTITLADTIKTLSDHSIGSTLILVGVADSVDELIHEHQSVERSLVQVRMPRMSEKELFEIVDKGLSQLNMTTENGVKERIARLSEGLPHYTHLLGLYSAQAAIRGGRDKVTGQDVETAMGTAVDKMQQSILSSYHKATRSPRRVNLFSRVLLACALARTDEVGSFAAVDVRTPMSRIMGKTYDIPAFSRHLDEFSDAKRGPVLQKSGSARAFRFRFVNPLLQPFVLIHGLAKGLVTEELIRELQANGGPHRF